MALPMSALPSAFRRLAASNLAAQFSEQMALAAAPLVAVLALDATAAQTGYLQTAQTLPFLLLSLPAGVLADRMSRRALMTAAECVRACSLLALLALLWLGGLSLAWLAALGFLGAVGTVAYNVAAPALVPRLVPARELASANRWLELARSCAFSAGPAAGGALVGWMGAPTAYVLATTLSLLAAVLLAGLPQDAPTSTARRDVLAELRAGAAFVVAHPLLRPVLITAVFFNTAWFVLQAVYVVYAIERLGLSAAGVGITLGVYGAGMLAGAPAVVRRDDRAGAAVGACGQRHSAVDLGLCVRPLGGGGVLSVWRRADSMDHHHHHAAPGGDAECAAGPRIRSDPDRDVRRAARGRADRRNAGGARQPGRLPMGVHGRVPGAISGVVRVTRAAIAQPAGCGGSLSGGGCADGV
jgi:MFS family permease